MCNLGRVGGNGPFLFHRASSGAVQPGMRIYKGFLFRGWQGDELIPALVALHLGLSKGPFNKSLLWDLFIGLALSILSASL